MLADYVVVDATQAAPSGPLRALASLRQLRVFETVARLKSVSRASEEINLSQPAVTQAMAKLEKAFDAPLFERRRNGSYLTECGQILLLRTERIFAQIEQALCDPHSGAPFVDAANARIISGQITGPQIRALIAIAQAGSFDQAARASGISSATLHRPAREFEQLLRRTLYERTARGLRATRPGAELARRLRLAMLELDYAVEEFSMAAGSAKARIAIGILPLASTNLLAVALNDLLARYPDAHVKINEDLYNRSLDDLRSGAIDFLFGMLRKPDWATDVVEETLFYAPYVVAVRKDHPLTKLNQVSWDDLAAYEWVMAREGTPRRKAFERIFAAAGKLPRNSIETSSLTATRSILLNSDQITLLTKQEVETNGMSMLTAIPFDSLEVRRPDGIVFRADWRPTPVQTRFLEILRVRAEAIREPKD